VIYLHPVATQLVQAAVQVALGAVLQEEVVVPAEAGRDIFKLAVHSV